MTLSNSDHVTERVNDYADAGTNDPEPYLEGLTHAELELFHAEVLRRRIEGLWPMWTPQQETSHSGQADHAKGTRPTT